MGRKRGDKRNEKNRIIEVKEMILKENKTKQKNGYDKKVKTKKEREE